MTLTRLALLAWILVCSASTLCLGEPGKVDYSRQIRPILADNCYACHGPDEDNREGGFRIDQLDSALAEADSGSRPLVPGDAMDSELYVRLITEDEDSRMPPADSGKELTPEQIDVVRAWIDEGATWQEHWAFVPPQKSAVPRVSDPEWSTAPIDAFIFDRLRQEGLSPSPPADRRTLIRRVTFDLTGLPPTPAEVESFLEDESTGAFERVVDRLLESPQYGEHMARFWLDAARYGDTHGLHLDNYREMWPYRDWVITAFNENLPFDRFVTLQLAGDLLPDPTDDDLVATGFNRCHVTTNEGGSIAKEVFVRNVVDRVVTTGTVFMGLTLECTRCHDHKYDPLTMRDFYSLFAFFNSLDANPMDGNKARHDPVLTLPTEQQQLELNQLSAQIDQLRQEIKATVANTVYPQPAESATSQDSEAATPKLAKTNAADSEDSTEEATEYLTLDAWIQDQVKSEGKGLPKNIKQAIEANQEQRTPEQQQALRDYFVEHAYAPVRDAFRALHKSLSGLEAKLKDLTQEVPATLIYKEVTEPRPAFVLHRGEYDQQREQVTRATPPILPPMQETMPQNRFGLAQWLVSPDHPLTARVFVNRLWQQVFGTGIVKTTEDFGSQGQPPSHPKLLDWLAVQFIEDGWDVKAMMKRIVMSAAYRQSSQATPDRLARDPGNRLLSRGPRFRLDAEMLRDQALAVSGLLVNRVGGPSVKPPQPDGLWHAVGYSGSNTVRFEADEDPEKVHRRTLYTFIKRTAPPPQMSTFDAPSREFCAVRRERTNTPLQALLMLNDPQYVEAARGLAERVLHEAATSDAARAQYMFQLCTARLPDESETAELVQVTQAQRAKYEDDMAAAEALLKAAHGNVDEHADAAELAAWTVTANLVLNLDEVVNKN